jgi:hypothetical protein
MSERIQYIENKISEMKKQIDMKNRIVKLCENPDFKSLIIDYFCVTECARYVGVSTDPHMKPESREDALQTAQAAGIFKRWLNVTISLGEQAEQSLSQWEAELLRERQPKTDDAE